MGGPHCWRPKHSDMRLFIYLMSIKALQSQSYKEAKDPSGPRPVPLSGRGSGNSSHDFVKCAEVTF